MYSGSAGCGIACNAMVAKSVDAAGASVTWTGSGGTQERNIEAGVLLDDPRLAARLTRQFDELVARGALQRVR